MTKAIIVLKPFKFAHRGIDVEEFFPSTEPIETTDECADLAIEEKWAKAHKPRVAGAGAGAGAGAQAPAAAPAQAAADAAPEQAASAEAPETKSE